MARRHAVRIGRDQAVAYRAHVHDLERCRADPLDCAVVAAGVPDRPPGRSASLALCVRSTPDPAGPVGVTVHSVRGEAHVHRATDIGLYQAAMRWDAADLAGSAGRFGAELAEEGFDLPTAMAEVAAAMRAVARDGVTRTKAELSEAVTPIVAGPLAPWCAECGARHVHDGLFGYATLQAGLGITVGPRKKRTARFWYLPLGVDPGPLPDPADARRELVRRFLHLCGPATHEHVATWLGVTPAAGRALLRALEDELVAVEVAGWRAVMLADDLDAVRHAAPPRQVRLLPPHDPLTVLAAREVGVPDHETCYRMYQATGFPGWRTRLCKDEITIFVRPSRALTTEERSAIRVQAEILARLVDVPRAHVRYEPGH
jgi:Winged helix DNA-binding domain